MTFEVMDGNFSSIAMMAARGASTYLRWYLSWISVFHGLGDFIVQNVFSWLDAGMVETEHEVRVCSGELGIFAVLEGFH